MTRRSFMFGLMMAPLATAAIPTHREGIEYTLASFHVAGFQHHDGPKVISGMALGSELDLIPEPRNRHDAAAIRIELAGAHLGYVPRTENSTLNLLMKQDATLRCRVVEVSPRGQPWKALKVRVSLVQPAAS